MLFELIDVILRGCTGSHIDDVRRELEDDSLNKHMDMHLRDKELNAIPVLRLRHFYNPFVLLFEGNTGFCVHGFPTLLCLP